MENKVINQWDKAAKSYAENQRNAHNNLTNWEMLKNVLGDIQGKRILDAGCGDGFFTNQLNILGANIIGCDGSQNLIKLAKEDFKQTTFEVCDLKKKLPYTNNEFDIVVSSLTLMDIDEIDLFFSEANRILKPSGRLVFSIVHPCFFQGKWEIDEHGNKLYKKLEDYYNHTTLTLIYWGETTHYHRPLEWYSKQLKHANFYIEELLENPSDIEHFPHIKPQQKRIPLFVVFSCVKK